MERPERGLLAYSDSPAASRASARPWNAPLWGEAYGGLERMPSAGDEPKAGPPPRSDRMSNAGPRARLREAGRAWTQKGVAGMPLRRLIFLSSLVLAVAALSPATALGAANGTDRPVSGKSTSTTTVDLATGTGVSDGSGQVSHIGSVHLPQRLHVVHADRPNTFSLTLTASIVAANGDVMFTTATGTGTLTANDKRDDARQHDHRRHRPLR